MINEKWTLEEDEIVCDFCLENCDIEAVNLKPLYDEIKKINPNRTDGTIRLRYQNFLYLATNGKKGLSKTKKQQKTVYDKKKKDKSKS